MSGIPERILSGGQTGVDRAALGIPCGGWCPRGRRAEDGPIPERYPLTETRSARYAVRTRFNVRDSDGTLVLAGALAGVLAGGEPQGGTRLTIELANKLGRPLLVADPLAADALAEEGLAEDGASAEIGKLLGHTQTQTTARYAHLAEKYVAAAAEKTASFITSEIRSDGGASG